MRIKKEESGSFTDELLHGYISDESSFYGDETDKAELEHEVSTFKTLYYWQNIHPLSLATIAERQRAMEPQSSEPDTDVVMEDAPPPENPFAGRPEFYQRDEESVREFVRRLPPSSTSTSVVGPWIFVSNPYACRKVTSADIGGFRTAGMALLEAFEHRASTIKAYGLKKVQREESISFNRKNLEVDILECAREYGVTEGKWMLFVPEPRVDEVWEAVLGATTKGNLGIQAKVAVKDESSRPQRPRLIAVYTRDFADREDIRKVLVKLVGMGLTGSGYSKGQIYYKCDAFTYLDVFSKNKWGLPASMYSSGEMLRKG
ncbi:hypothetical protein FQN54_002546 [Arachnomyces sp. PD_36]|nr:hypothetical protein FQN54_002546 [Arachnomyces sp. PD_36]